VSEEAVKVAEVISLLGELAMVPRNNVLQN
jgi:hypothetical protein